MRKIRNSLCMILSLMLVILVFSPETVKAAENSYVHDPVLNTKAMEDIVVDDTAVYGFRPDPNSERLGEFADADWSDPVLVEQWRQERISYHEQFSTMYDKWQEMEEDGSSMEEIARTVSAMRNQIRLDAYKDDPEGLEKCKASNLAKYGSENGPTAESLYEKYGSWETVLLKSFSENPGMDACLGLYDMYYDNYSAVGSLKESTQQTYTVKAGDTLCAVSLKYFGTEINWPSLYEDNRDIIEDPGLIYAGQQLTINLQ